MHTDEHGSDENRLVVLLILGMASIHQDETIGNEHPSTIKPSVFICVHRGSYVAPMIDQCTAKGITIITVLPTNFTGIQTLSIVYRLIC